MSFVHQWAVGFFESPAVGRPVRCARPLPRDVVDRLMLLLGEEASGPRPPARWAGEFLVVEYLSVHRSADVAERCCALVRAIVEITGARVLDVTSGGVVRALEDPLRGSPNGN